MIQPRPLSQDSISTLRKLLGVAIYTIFTPPLDAAGAHLAAWKLSMMLGKNSFITFSCEWSETPRFLNDSWLITVSESNEPIGVDINSSGAIVGASTIKMYGAKPIKSIEIFEYSCIDDEAPEESVQYDQAILFHCEEDRRFCIACTLSGPGVATYMNFSEDARVIQEMLGQSKSRLVLQKDDDFTRYSLLQ